MKKYKGFVLLIAVVIVMMTIGYLMKEERVVYNCGDTYYVSDYFTISKIISLLLVFIGLLILGYKKLIAKM